MPVQDSAPKPNKIVWALAAVLCACTLVALWVTGARVKAMKLAARRGEVIEPVGGSMESTPSQVVLRRDQRVRVAHFGLRRNAAGNVEVVDVKERPLVEFVRIAKGQVRRWQELQLTFADVSPEEATVGVELKPGATCFGAGLYRALRPGLQVQFAKGGAVIVTAWDPKAPEATLKFQGPDVPLERKVALHADGKIFGVAFRLEGEGLLLEEAE